MDTSAIGKPTCLIVEDELLIGMDLEDELVAAGYQVEWVASLEMARQAIQTFSPSVAIIDVKLRDEQSVDLAAELKRRGIPFIVHSGSLAGDAPPEMTGVPWLTKPAERSAIVQALDSILRIDSGNRPLKAIEVDRDPERAG